MTQWLEQPLSQTPNPVSKKPKRRPPHSVLLWPPRGEFFPAIHIDGSPVPPDQVTAHKDAKAAGIAAKFWTRRVAHEVAQNFPEDQREDAERFVLRHKLSIMKAFHQRLARAIVVEVLRGLWVSERHPE